MKLSLIITGLFLSIIYGYSQPDIQDPEAGKVLERVALKFKNMKSMQTGFELVIEDRIENRKNSSSGNLLMKEKKYKLESQGTIVFFDGKTMWTYVADNNEVTITEPEDGEGDFLADPSGFFKSYKSDFKYRYVREAVRQDGSVCHEIDLFPMNINQPYTRVKVLIDTKTDLPVSIKSMGKDGVDYTVNLNNIVLNREVGDATFTFDPAKYKKVEVVDMRGL